ncbi:MAG TPA: GIY-YIG nuclease family protein [Alphaproteobacteria bacterium]|jgi:putative endonuclease|nr:GIY-YIG nuclease family protein [Alphaproteobacteria bacterium]
MKQFFVYLLASERNGTLYVGRTSNLLQRIWQHKQKVADGFTERYGIGRLVWFAECATAEAAITREKQIKKWNRAWKMRLIEEQNRTWRDLYKDIAP